MVATNRKTEITKLCPGFDSGTNERRRRRRRLLLLLLLHLVVVTTPRTIASRKRERGPKRSQEAPRASCLSRTNERRLYHISTLGCGYRKQKKVKRAEREEPIKPQELLSFLAFRTEQLQLPAVELRPSVCNNNDDDGSTINSKRQVPHASIHSTRRNTRKNSTVRGETRQEKDETRKKKGEKKNAYAIRHLSIVERIFSFFDMKNRGDQRLIN